MKNLILYALLMATFGGVFVWTAPLVGVPAAAIAATLALAVVGWVVAAVLS